MKEKELAMRSYKELADHEMDLWIKVNFSMTNNQGWRPYLLEYLNWTFWFSLLCPRPSFLFTKQFLWKVTKSHCIVKTMSQLNGYISLPSFSFSENVCWPWQKVQVNKENSTWNPQTDFFYSWLFSQTASTKILCIFRGCSKSGRNCVRKELFCDGKVKAGEEIVWGFCILTQNLLSQTFVLFKAFSPKTI